MGNSHELQFGNLVSDDEVNERVVFAWAVPQGLCLGLKLQLSVLPCAVADLACACVLSSGVSPHAPAMEQTRSDFLYPSAFLSSPL